MYCIRGLFTVATGLMCFSLFGQNNVTGYFEPDVGLGYTVSTNYSHFFQLSQRSYLYDDELELRARQIDIVHFSQLNIALYQSIAIGIQYRFRDIFEEDRENELRLTQQYNITDKSGSMRFGNRFRAEQRIQPSLTVHRFRYRLAIDLPLSGEELNVGEAYFVASTESLLSVARGIRPEFDQRLTANIGWLLDPDLKLEVGGEYRAENYAQETENVLFLLTSLTLSL